MTRNFRKLKYISNIILNGIHLSENFNIWYGLGRTLTGLTPKKIREHSVLCSWIGQCCDKYVKRYLLNQYHQLIQSRREETISTENRPLAPDSCLWIFWYQGLENAPEIVQACVDSIRRHACSHPVVLLTKENLEKYVHFPKYIYQKLKDGTITMTHFSDLIRVALLSQYGGIWMDATMYIVRDIDCYVGSAPFFSIKIESKNENICRQRQWTGFCMASGQSNSMICLLYKWFMLYWSKENCLIAYLLLDFMLTILYENDPLCKNLIDSVPINNKSVHRLEEILNKPYEFIHTLDHETGFYKLTYKKRFKKQSKGSETVYSYLISEKVI